VSTPLPVRAVGTDYRLRLVRLAAGLRAAVFFAAGLRAAVRFLAAGLRAAVRFLAAGLRAAVFFAAGLRAAVRFLAAGLRAAVFLAAGLRAAVFLAAGLRAAVRFLAAGLRAAVFFAAGLRVAVLFLALELFFAGDIGHPLSFSLRTPSASGVCVPVRSSLPTPRSAHRAEGRSSSIRCEQDNRRRSVSPPSMTLPSRGRRSRDRVLGIAPVPATGCSDAPLAPPRITSM